MISYGDIGLCMETGRDIEETILKRTSCLLYLEDAVVAEDLDEDRRTSSTVPMQIGSSLEKRRTDKKTKIGLRTIVPNAGGKLDTTIKKAPTRNNKNTMYVIYRGCEISFQYRSQIFQRWLAFCVSTTKRRSFYSGARGEHLCTGQSDRIHSRCRIYLR